MTGTLLVDTSFLGDVLCAEPMVRAVAARWPDEPVDFLTSPGGAQILRGHPQLRTILVFDKKNKDKGLFGLKRMARQLRQRGYQRVYCSHRSWRTAALLAWGRIPDRTGFSNASAAWLYHHRIDHRQDLHEIERNLQLVGGGSWTAPRMYPGPPERDSARSLLQSLAVNRPRVALAPGSIWATKRWPEESWQQLATELVQADVGVVLLGGPDDRDLCTRIARCATADPTSQGSGLVNLAGDCDLLTSAAVMEQVSAVVSNDSAPMHMAVAMGTPVIALYCSTVPAFGFAPRGPRDQVFEVSGLDCRPCGIHGHPKCPRGHFRCGKELAFERVAAAVLALLGGKSDFIES